MEGGVDGRVENGVESGEVETSSMEAVEDTGLVSLYIYSFLCHKIIIMQLALNSSIHFYYLSS